MTTTSPRPAATPTPAPPAPPATPATDPASTHDPRLHVQIRTHLHARLLAGTIPAGTPLPINDLARQWGASRETVRKALRALENYGLIKCYPHYGYRVLPAAIPAPGEDPRR